MAEGQTRLNSQVVTTGCWGQSARVARIAARPWSNPPDSDEREGRLEHIRLAVEAEILPRVAVGHDPGLDVARSDLGETDVLGFVRVLLSPGDEASVSAFVGKILARGVSIGQVYLNLFQPAARHIGELWCDDLCTFVDVTLAVGTMQKLLRTLGPGFHRHGSVVDGGRHALLVPLPGDQHTFGLSMVAEFFRRAGWSVWSTPFGSRASLGEALQKGWYAVVGFSASTEDRLDELAAVIRQTRRESCNSAIGVLVGGPLFVAHPEFVIRVGADAMGADATQALARAECYVARAAGP